MSNRRVKMVRKWAKQYEDGTTDRYRSGGYYDVSQSTYLEIVADEAGHWEDEDPPWIPDAGPIETAVDVVEEESPADEPTDDETLGDDFVPPFENGDFE